jgi:hypothetical protein
MREGLEQREIAGALAEELMKKGYSVVYLHEPPLAAVSVAPPAAPWTQPAGGAIPASSQPAGGAIPASTQPAGEPTGAPVRIVVAPPSLAGDLSARYAAAREARADILLEVTARVETRVDVYDAGGSYGPYIGYRRYGRHGPYWGYWGHGYYGREVYVREWRSISRATLRVSNPRDRTLLATVTVQYASPTDDPADVAKDLCLGLDFIRQGWPAQRVTLKGPPENVQIQPPVRPPPATTQPASQP